MEALENLDVWKRASRLTVKVSEAMQACKDSGFKYQVTQSALSIPSNIAEGYERDSLTGCIEYLLVAKGSCGELCTQIMIGRKAGFIETSSGKILGLEAKEISRLLYGLIKYCKDKESIKA